MYKNFNNYEVLADGRIWSKYSNKFLKPKTTRDGYQQVSLYDNNGKQHVERLHKVIYFAVNGLWEYPENMELHHLDENKCNNQIGNLLLCTRKENLNFGTRNARASKAMKGKFINRQDQSKRVGAFKDGVLQMVFPSTGDAHRKGYDKGAICNCCRGKLPHYKGYEWQYLDGEAN